MSSYINEYPHPRLVVLLDPTDSDLSAYEAALANGATAVEIPLLYRESDGKAIWLHDHQIFEERFLRLGDVLDYFIGKKGAERPTMYDNDRQFFIVLVIHEDKDSEFMGPLIDQIVETLGQYQTHLSTAVGPDDGPRWLTVIVSGELEAINRRIGPELDRLCIVEGFDYGPRSDFAIVPLSPYPFQWISFPTDDQRGKVNPQHHRNVELGHRSFSSYRFNVRLWYADENLDDERLRNALATGADSVNARPNNHTVLNYAIRSQRPQGTTPCLASAGSGALLTWEHRTPEHQVTHYPYVALGTFCVDELRFTRQINLFDFLEETPVATRPSAALLPDGTILIVFEDPRDASLWYLTGRFVGPDRFITFDGGQGGLLQRLQAAHPGGGSPTSKGGLLGRNPTLAVAPNATVLIVYEAPAGQGELRYYSGILTADGRLSGREYFLTFDELTRGHRPAATIDARYRVVIVYEGVGNEDAQWLRYFSGTFDSLGSLSGAAATLTIWDPIGDGYARQGRAPSVAIDAHDHVLVAYEGTSDERLFYSVGRLRRTGEISTWIEFRLTQDSTYPTGGPSRRGHTPHVSFDDQGHVYVIYEGTRENRLWYVSGRLKGLSGIVGDERLLDMAFEAE